MQRFLSYCFWKCPSRCVTSEFSNFIFSPSAFRRRLLRIDPSPCRRSMSANVGVAVGPFSENPLDKDCKGSDDNANFADDVPETAAIKISNVELVEKEGQKELTASEEDDCDEEYDDDDHDDDEEHCDDFSSNVQLLRNRRAKTPNIPQTVTVLTHHFDPNVDTELAPMFGECGTILGRVYLIGTAHFSHESHNDVRDTIRETQPDIVMVELCPSRVAVLALNEETLLEEARSLTTEKMLKIIREAGVVQGVMHILLLSMSAHITRQLGMAPGGEFRVAFHEARKVPGCRWHLGDRLIQTTMARALGTLSVWQKLRLFWSIVWSHNIQITKEEVEKCKQRDLLEELLREMAGEFPELSRIFVDERDQYMAHTLCSLLRHAALKRVEQLGESEPWEPVVIVGVVGMGHVPGIMANFGKDIDIKHLLKTPKTSRWTRCVKFAVKGAIISATAYAVYKSVAYFVR